MLAMRENPSFTLQYATAARRCQGTICCFDLPDLHFGGPRATKTPYVSVAILDSHITIERQGGNYHIASRFNLETTILDYHIREKLPRRPRHRSSADEEYRWTRVLFSRHLPKLLKPPT